MTGDRREFPCGCDGIVRLCTGHYQALPFRERARAVREGRVSPEVVAAARGETVAQPPRTRQVPTRHGNPSTNRSTGDRSGRLRPASVSDGSRDDDGLPRGSTYVDG